MKNNESQQYFWPAIVCIAAACMVGGCGSGGSPALKVAGAPVGSQPVTSPPDGGALLAVLTAGSYTGESPSGIVVNPVTGAIYVSDFSGRVTGFSPVSNTASTLTAVFRQPTMLASDSGSNRVYTTNLGTSTATSSTEPGVSVIDGASGKILINLLDDLNPQEIAVNSVTHKIYVINQIPPASNSTVLVLDPTTFASSHSIPIGTSNNQGERTAVLDPASNRLYVPNGTDATIAVIDGSTDSAAATFGPYPSQVGPLAELPGLHKLYALDIENAQVFVLNASTGALLKTVAIGSGSASDIATNPLTGRIFVTNYNDGTLTVIDGNTDSVVNSIPMTYPPHLIAVNSNLNRLYVTNTTNNTVAVLDGTKL